MTFSGFQAVDPPSPENLTSLFVVSVEQPHGFELYVSMLIRIEAFCECHHYFRTCNDI